MNMHDTGHPSESPHETAAHWHVRLREEAGSTRAHGELRAWLEADIAHRLAYADVCAAAHACDQVLQSESPAEAVRGIPAFGGPPRPLRQPATTASRRLRRVAVVVALAASVVAAVFAPTISLQLRADLIGQPGLVQRHTLDDGSVLSLDGASAVRVSYADDRRHVEVLRGAVHVDVRADAARPFVVRSGNIDAKALGTRYAVSRVNERHRVAVDAGRVSVRIGDREPVELVAGRTLTAADDGEGLQIEDTGMLDASWITGQLVFSATPFADAVAAMARHLPERVIVSGEDPVAAVTAVAPVSEAAQLLERLGRERGYRSTRIPGLLIVLY